MVALPCWSKLLCGQIWYVPAITAGPWWRGMLHSNSKLCLRFFFAVSNYYVIAVCILAWPGLHTFKIGVWEVWGGGFRFTIVQDAFEWQPMSALWNTSVHLNFYLGDAFAWFPAFQIEFVWKISNIFSISFRIFAVFFFPIYSTVWSGQIRCEAPSFQNPHLWLIFL